MVERLCECKEGSPCGEIFGQIPNLNLKKKISADVNSCECSVCGQVFICPSPLNRHILPHSGHKLYEREKRGVKPYKCKQCEKIFLSPINVQRHMVTHAGNRPHKCKKCGRTLKFLYLLLRHKVIYTGEKPCEWKKGGKALRFCSSFQKHGRTHGGETLVNVGNAVKPLDILVTFTATEVLMLNRNPMNVGMWGTIQFL